MDVSDLNISEFIVETDIELDLLTLALSALEPSFLAIYREISYLAKSGFDLLGEDILEHGEHLVGLAFVACQRFIDSTRLSISIKLGVRDVLKFGRKNSSGLFFVSLINSVANYWKHADGWDVLIYSKYDYDLNKVVYETDISNLIRTNKLAKDNYEILVGFGSWPRYPCTNSLHILAPNSQDGFSELVEILIEWRDEVRASFAYKP